MHSYVDLYLMWQLHIVELLHLKDEGYVEISLVFSQNNVKLILLIEYYLW